MNHWTHCSFIAVALATGFLRCSALAAADSQGEKMPAPLFDGLGHHHHPITTHSKPAQQYFDQGLTLCHAFNHAEDDLPYMEPAYWPIPVRPTLGAALLKAGKAAEAERLFREDLQRWPRNGWGLLGLERSLRAQGKNESADLVHREFEAAWARADVKLDLAWF